MSRGERIQAMIATGDKGCCKDCSFASAIKIGGTGEHFWYCYNLDVLRPIDVLDNGDPSGCHGGFLQKPERVENMASINGDTFMIRAAAVEYDLGFCSDPDRMRIWRRNEE